MRYLLINNNKVINVIEWNGEDEYRPGASYLAIPAANFPDADIGWIYDGTYLFSPKNPSNTLEPTEVIELG